MQKQLVVAHSGQQPPGHGDEFFLPVAGVMAPAQDDKTGQPHSKLPRIAQTLMTRFVTTEKRILFMQLKLTLVFMLAGICYASAGTFAQQITLHEKNTPLEKVLHSIEKQAAVTFIAKAELLDKARRVTVELNGTSLKKALEACFKDQPLTYNMVGNIITVKPLPASLPADPAEKKFISVTGNVYNADNQPLEGASIGIRNNGTAVITDSKGYFRLNAEAGQTLVVSFVGHTTQEIILTEERLKQPLVIRLKAVTNTYSEVVVTALGIEKNKRSISYASEKVDMNSLTTFRDVNLGNALAGKIAGVSITASSGAAGVQSEPQIIIRGHRSINGNNQPLIVVDGVPFSTGGGGLQNINPDDVESMNVLKGPAAAALYGSSANNGVILVTTKRGKSGQARIDINSVTSFDLPYLFPPFQNEYGQGLDGLFQPNAEIASWGPKMNGQEVTDWTGKKVALAPQPNNAKDFFNTGRNMTNTLTYSAGNEKTTTYFSYSNTTAQGILETNKLNRHNINLRMTTKLMGRLKLDFRITYLQNKLTGKPITGDDIFSPMHQFIQMPRSIRTEDIRTYSYYDAGGSLRQTTWAPGSISAINPFWSMHGRDITEESNSVNTLATLKYEFTNWLYLQMRGSFNTSNSDNEGKYYWDIKYVNSGKGNYTTAFSKGKSYNGDLLLGMNKNVTDQFNMNISLGASIADNKGRSMSANAGGLTTENKFALAYAMNPTNTDGASHTQKQSIYGMGQVGFRNALFVDVTARNDWSSTLPRPYSYFYPSFGLTGVISDLVKMPKVISFIKLRGSYAEVGNDAGFAQIFQTYASTADGPVGMLYPSSTKAPINLIPEKTKSWEAGAELYFFDRRLGIDLTLYKSNTYNQLITVTAPSTSGYSSALINAGNIQNKGIELMITAQPVTSQYFNWSLSLNFARNNNKVIELTETLNRYQIASPELSVGSTFIETGRPYGEIYSKGFVRNDKDQVVVDALGMPKITTGVEIYLGNFNYDWRSGITNNLSYKQWNLSFLIDLNYGGVRQSATDADMLYSGTNQLSLRGREDGIIVDGVKEDGTPNTTKISAQAYGQTLGARNGIGELFNYSATYSRLRELAIGYSLPLKGKHIRELRISAIGRNLFFLYNGADWFDPDTTYDSNRNGQGAESAFLPVTRSLGLNVKLSF